MDVSKVKGTIEVDCRKCEKLKDNGCSIYGNDADMAVEKCAKDCFREYRVTRPKEGDSKIVN